ncbi:hypothetical protein [Streptomyces similanensis]|uniref:Lipoprotein n=1 Tax=Streptomyces similanensis TaxID=1274988 RepID=A0ABP9L458_9ACTN
MNPRSSRLAALFGIACLGLLALTGCSADAGPRRCPTTHTAAGDYVPAGPRPCILYGTGHGHPAAGANHSAGSGGRDSAKESIKDASKTPAKGSAKAPAVKTPAAPKSLPGGVSLRKR